MLRGHRESTDMALLKSSQPWCTDSLLLWAVSCARLAASSPGFCQIHPPVSVVPLFYLYLFLTLPLPFVLPSPPPLGPLFSLALCSLSLRLGRGNASVAAQGQLWCWAGGGRVSGTPDNPSEDSSILALGSMLPGPRKGVGPGPSLLRGFFGQEAPWSTALAVHCSQRSLGLWGECRTFKALSNVSQDIGMSGGQLIPNGHDIPTCLCLVMPRGLAAKPVGCSAGLAPAGRPCQGPVAGEWSG